MIKALLLSFSFCFISIVLFAQENERSILSDLIASLKQTNTLEFVAVQEERIKGEIKKSSFYCRIQEAPKKVYLKNLYPDKGMEVLYCEGENNNKARIRINRLINVNLSPNNRLVRKGWHRTIPQAGFNFLAEMLDLYMNDSNYRPLFDESLAYGGQQLYQNILCHKVIIDYKDFSYSSYTMQENETVTDLANQYKISEYLLMEKNKGLKELDEDYPGKEIMLPNSYGSYVEIWVSVKNYLPVMLEVHDEKGLFERYHFNDLKVNPAFESTTFSHKNEEYDF